MAAFTSENKMAAFTDICPVCDKKLSWSKKKSFEPDLNQQPMDVWQCTTTVHRSTNWAIEGKMTEGELAKVIILI